MKLNENGDFCLLYIESADDKQSLFEVIAEQKKPVVLMLPLLPGQARSRLFQRPEDFSDLKYVRRQANVSIIFLTSGSEQLAQLAARYGFPAYASIDVFAETLAHGRRAEREEKEQKGGYPYTSHRASTGPLVSPASPIATIRRSLQTAPLYASKDAQPWPIPGSGAFSSAPVERATPLPRTPSTPLHPPTDMAFSPSFKRDAPPAGLPPRSLVTGRLSEEREAAEREGAAYPSSSFSEIPARRSALSPNGRSTRHPGWEAEEYGSDDRSYQGFQEQETLSLPSGRATSRSLPDLPTQPPASRTAFPELPTQPPPAPAPGASRSRRGFTVLLVLLSLLILGGAGLGSLIVISHSPPAVSVAQQVGSVAFLSSGQLNDTTSQGIDDHIQITLHNISTPAAGKSYYAWLLGDADQAESQAILLGRLSVINGSASLLYPGDVQYTNLLQSTSRFLITEEDSTVTPLLPSPDTSNWRYYGAIPATPDPNTTPHYSYLNHLRHLLADEPILDQMELPGGLSNWFTRNTEELVGLTSGVRDQWQSTQSVTSVRDQAISVLAYLDGMSFLSLDIPPSLAKLHVPLNTRLAGLGLLNVRGVGQNPPSYMDQFAYHLNGLINAPQAPTNIRSLVTPLSSALSNVVLWLQNLRSDDKKILAMTNAQLGQPQALSLMDDMVVQASNAYTGGSDPATGQFKPGVVWIQQHLQSLATIAVSTYTSGAAVPEIGPSTQHSSSFVLQLLAAWKEDL